MSYFRNKAVARTQLGLDGAGIVNQIDTELGSSSWRNSSSDFDTLADLTAATVDANVNVVTVNGYATYGDAAPARYKRVGSAPIHAGKTTSNAGGVHWEILGPDLYIEQFGAVGDGVTDDLPALVNAEDAREALDAILHFGPANYYLNNPNSMVLLRPRWQGSEANATVLTCNGSSGICFLLTGAGGFTAGYFRNLTIWASASRTTGQALRLDGDSTFQPDEFKATNIKITGAGTWDIPLYLYGGDRTSPQGLRFVTFRDLFIGRDVTLGIYADNCVQLEIFGGGIYGGTTNDLTLTSTHASLKSSDCMIGPFKVNGDVVFDEVDVAIFNGIAASVFLSVNSANVFATGVCASVTNSGTSNAVSFA